MRAIILSTILTVIVTAEGEASSSPSSIGLVGGDDGGTAYAAIISPAGDIINLPNGGDPLPSNGNILCCAINGAGAGLIGGVDNSMSAPGYAALVSSSGVLTNLSAADLPLVGGEISSCAINAAGIGLIVGSDNNGILTPYAAFVSPSSAITILSTAPFLVNGQLNGCALNAAGTGIIGGESGGGGPPFAALVSFPNTVINLPTAGGDPLPANGNIQCCAINDSGHGLIGGLSDAVGVPAYAALVPPSGQIINLPTAGDPLPSTNSIIKSCAINAAGTGIIGGGPILGIAPAYAALVSPLGVVTNLPTAGDSLPANGNILSCAINSAGVGIIGGGNNLGAPAYAALVSPSGVVTNLPTGLGNLPSNGIINSCAINEAGIGLIGGNDISGSAYAALVSPLGAVTNLPTGLGKIPLNGNIASVANTDALLNILNTVTPTSIGPYGSPTNSLLAASYALESHVTIHHKKPFRGKSENNNEISLLADARATIPRHKDKKEPPYSIWIEPFAEYIHLDAQNEIPSLTNEIVGALAAFDARMKNYVVGGGLAYVFNYTHYSHGLGHAKINEELAVVYGSFQLDNIFINANLWGGFYQLYNKRNTLGFITSTAHTHGWLLSPHLEISSPQTWNWFTLEPFIMADWANSWQNRFREHGKSGLNLAVPRQYASLLRSEVGLRFYEQLRYSWGQVIIEEKVSYINQKPFHVQSANTFFVGSISTFSIATGSSRMQNLGGAELNCSIIPRKSKYPYVSLDAQGEFGSSYQSYFAGLEIGMNF